PVPGRDLEEIRSRCHSPIERDQSLRLLSDMGLLYGPAFQGLVRVWQGAGEAIAEIEAPACLNDGLDQYRLHPPVLDACFQSALAAMPQDMHAPASRTRAYVPERIERLRFYASPPARFLAIASLRARKARELIVDLDLVTEAGETLATVAGLACRQIEAAPPRLHSAMDEDRWQQAPRAEDGGTQGRSALPAMRGLNAFLYRENAAIHHRFNRPSFQTRFRSHVRAVVAAHIARALSALGWTGELSTEVPATALC